MVAWHQMYQAAHGTDERRTFSRATLARIGRFAQPHRRRIVAFVGLSVLGAGLAVATPVLAGHVVDAIVRGGPASAVIVLALAIAGIAVAEAGVGIVQRWLSSTLGEGLILDLRAAVFDHVQRQPVAFFTRTRTGALVSRLNNDVIGAAAGVLRHAVGRGGQRRHAGADARRHARPVVAGHGAGAAPAADLRAARQADGPPPRRAQPGGRRPQRGDGQPDDRAVLRTRRHARQAVRAARGRDPRVRRPRRPGARHRRAHRDGAVGLRVGADARLGAGVGAGVRPGWLVRAGGLARPGRRRRARAAAHPPLRTADVAGLGPRRGDERAGELRARLRGAGPPAADRRARDAPAAARRRALGGARRGAVRLPRGRPRVARVAGGRGAPGHPRRCGGAARRVVPGRAGADGRAGRLVGRGQVDDRLAAPPSLRRRRGRGPHRRRRRPRPARSTRSAARSGWSRRTGTCSTSRCAPTSCSPGPTPTRRSCGTRCAAPDWPISSRRCPTGWTRWSANAATASPAASASG